MNIIVSIINFLERLMITKKDESERVTLVLKNINKKNPKDRDLDIWDKEFYKLVPVLHQYTEALDFLNRFGFICDVYFDELSKFNPNEISFLQKTFCRVSRSKYTDKYICRYPNLLFKYLQRWDLLPSVKSKLSESKIYYADVISLYNKFAPEYSREQI